MTERDYVGDLTAAKSLAYTLRKYWMERGYNPEVNVEKFKKSDSGPTLYAVRSNINPNWKWTPILRRGAIDVR